jgi:hypothetical protein
MKSKPLQLVLAELLDCNMKLLPGQAGRKIPYDKL